MFLIFDTETTGFFNKSLSLDDAHQGRICQLAALLLDENFEEVAQLSTLIAPAGWIMSPGAESVHKISQAKCSAFGISNKSAMSIFNQMSIAAKYKIAHNSRFDTQMIDNENFLTMTAPINWNKTICTMDSTTELCKLKGKIPGKYKWPKLIEAYQHIFKKSFDEAHDAMADVRACAEVFKWLVDNKHIAI